MYMKTIEFQDYLTCVTASFMMVNFQKKNPKKLTHSPRILINVDGIYTRRMIVKF